MFKPKEKLIVLGLCTFGLLFVASAASATTCPPLKIDGTTYNACKVTQGTCHYMTPYSTTINDAYVDLIGQPDKYWNNKPSLGNKECDDMPCTFTGPFIHWIYNYQNLVTSHYCPPVVTCEPDPEPSCDGHCGETLKWNICVDNQKQQTSKTCEACPCIPEHNPPVCTTQTCGQSLPWKDSCGNDETPVQCEECPCIPNEDNKVTCTEQDCGKTLEWINNCGDKKYVECEKCACVPVHECEENECGWKMDNCGEWFACRNNCPPPPPPPGRWPTANCEICRFSEFFVLHTSKDVMLQSGVLIPCQTEHANFSQEAVVVQIVIDADEAGEYIVWNGDFNDDSKRRARLFSFTGPGTVTIPYPPAGYPIQQFTDLWMTGGVGTVHVFIRDTSARWIIGTVCQ